MHLKERETSVKHFGIYTTKAEDRIANGMIIEIIKKVDVGVIERECIKDKIG